MATGEAPTTARRTGRAWAGPRGLDRFLSRSIVYAALTGVIVVTYAASVVLLRSLLPGETPYAVALLSTGAAALVALPLRDRLQRGVSRLLYGDRDDPYRAIARLGTHLEASVGADQVPTVVVDTVAQALRLPFVAMELTDVDGPILAAAHGTQPTGDLDLLYLPLTYRGEDLGNLILAPRSPGETLNRADRRLLADLGRQAGPAIQAARLTADLRRSRERLVTTREEERRRLRRDLHDGVGPSLAGALMKMEVARARLSDDPDTAHRLLGELTADTRQTIDEVRRLTYDLRPPALDELGLVGALREQIATFAGASAQPLMVEIEATELPPLPAAVEVAAYRIGLEALTNVIRHAAAERATLRLSQDGGDLVVEVEDDGRGVDQVPHPGGVGHRSMVERAEELGGRVVVTDATPRGTLVRARLPLRQSDV